MVVEIYRQVSRDTEDYTQTEVIHAAYNELINNYSGMDEGDLVKLLQWIYEEGQHAGALNGYY